LLPALNDAYKAAGFVDNKVSRLVVIMGKDGFKIGATAYYVFQYAHIGLGELGFTANGQILRFVFSDIQPKLLTVQSRNLLRIFDYIALRRMPWIRLAVDGSPDNEPIITGLKVSDWLRQDHPAVNHAQSTA
jgi:hypothetical protein